jgi:Na+/H+ antiporter NhaD/arsenite permease-like protein
VPNLDESLKLAVVGGAVTGGGLTVIANAPNPAGQALLARFFGDSVSPLYLAAAAIGPTIVAAIVLHML